MGMGFQISDEDIQNVMLNSFGLKIELERAEELRSEINEEDVEDLALHGYDLEEQTEMAYDEIADQLARALKMERIDKE